MAAKKVRVVTAERLVLEDRKGRVRAELKTTEDGSPHLVLRDATGNLTVSLSGRAPPSLQLFDRDNKLRVSLVIAPDGLPGLVFHGSHGGADVHIGSMPRGPRDRRTAGMLVLSDGRKAHVMGYFGEDGGGMLLATDAEGNARVELPSPPKPSARSRRRRRS